MIEILKYSLSIIIGSGLGTFIAQKLFEQKLNKKLYRFTKLYSDKLDIIKNLFKLLVRAEKGLEILLSQREPNEKKEKEQYYEMTIKPMNEFIETFEENEIVFEKSIVDQINNIIDIFRNAKNTHFFANSMESDRGSQAWENAVSKKQELFNKLELEFPKLKMKLKKEFQERYEILAN